MPRCIYLLNETGFQPVLYIKQATQVHGKKIQGDEEALNEADLGKRDNDYAAKQKYKRT